MAEPPAGNRAVVSYGRDNRKGDGPEQKEVTGGSQVELDGLPQEAEQRSDVLLEGLRR